MELQVIWRQYGGQGSRDVEFRASWVHRLRAYGLGV